MESPRWKIITPSKYEWERRALDFIRIGLPDHDPYRAWANFEFQTADGAIYEVDLLVLTKLGFWLVECKAWAGGSGATPEPGPGHADGKTISEDNPVLLANRKAKALVVAAQGPQPPRRSRCPGWMPSSSCRPMIVQCDLTGPARNRVFLKDHPTENERKGILAALMNREGPGIDPDLRSAHRQQRGKGPVPGDGAGGDSPIAAVSPNRRLHSRRPDCRGPGYQDRLAKHASFENVFCRVRQYTVAQASSEEDRQRLKRAAAREFQIIQTLDHPGILPGPGLQGTRDSARPCSSAISIPNADPLRSLSGNARPQADDGPAARSPASDRRRRPLRPSQAGDPSEPGTAEHPRHRCRLREIPHSRSTTGKSVSGTRHRPRPRATMVENLVETQSLVYMSPEADFRSLARSPRRRMFSRSGPSPSTSSPPAHRPETSPNLQDPSGRQRAEPFVGR